MASYTPSGLQGEPPPPLRASVEAALGRAWVGHTRPKTGLSDAHRFVVELAGGERVFVKAATTAATDAWLRNERLALSLAPPQLAPRELAWIDDGPFPILVTEALRGHWPAGTGVVVWRPGDLEAVADAIRRLAATPPPALPAQPAATTDGWERILKDPQPVLGLRLWSEAWLAANGEALAAAERGLLRHGGAFVHGDMRSDNICVTPDGVKFVDWSNARRAAAATDFAAFLPAAHLEEGPAPFALYPEGGAWGAAQGAELAWRAATDTAAPAWLMRVFRRLARINVDWAVAGLGLSPRDEPAR
jgi:aminoglycoside phosphotransferase (APT) family kinase protein